MKQSDIIPIIASEMGLPEDFIQGVVGGFYKFIRTKASELPLKEDLTEEQFNALKTSFNIPSLGKLAVTYDRYSKIKSSYKLIQEIKKQNAKNKENQTS